ncbi:oligosaccharide flippase family protein [Halosimplex salinum]|uniref:oligosaccharide flippase family protein n=1 Tax=Halosimplex salinum TaxID=1710538 RepID=UPI0013DE6B0A|nr:polysaccharide biosynthesis C-terminal domain-containing protein [Halosimplex salinum]
MSSRIGKTAVIHFLTQIGTTVAGFVATWYINWRLGPGVFGSYSTALALLFWLNIPASALGDSMTKRISEGDRPGAFVSTGFLLNIGIHLAIVAVIVAFRGQVNVFVGTDVALLLASLVGGRGVFDATLYALRGNKQVDTAGFVKTGEQVVRSAVQIGALFFLGVGVAGLVAGYSVAVAISTVAGLFVLKTRYERPSMEQVRSLFAFARFAWLGTIKNKAFAWSDVMMMRALSLSIVGLASVSKVQIGIYTVSWTVASVLALFSISINKTLFPEISELGVKDDYDQIHHLLNEGIAFTGVLLVPGLLGAVTVGETLLTIFGPEYARGGTILVVLIAARLFAAYGDYLNNAINAVNRPDVAFKVNFVYVVANLSLNAVLITLFGWYGAAAATALSALGSVAVAGYALSTIIGSIDVPYGEIARQLAASALMFAVVFGLDSVLPQTLLTAIVIVAVGAALYITSLTAISSRVRTKLFSVLA